MGADVEGAHGVFVSVGVCGVEVCGRGGGGQGCGGGAGWEVRGCYCWWGYCGGDGQGRFESLSILAVVVFLLARFVERGNVNEATLHVYSS